MARGGVSMNQATTLTFYPSKYRRLRLLIVSFVFALIGFLMIRDEVFMGWFVLISFGIGCLISIVLLLPNSSYLRISNKGFEVCSLFRGKFFGWDEVDRFNVQYIGLNKLVVFNYSSNHAEFKAAKKVAKILAVFEGALPDTYGKKAEELAMLLNEWKNKSSKNLLEKTSKCPACGCPLDFMPWDGGLASFELCPHCGIQFGYNDATGGDEILRQKIYKEWRAEWIKNGSLKNWAPTKEQQQIIIKHAQK